MVLKMTELYVGTSGWNYFWNKGKSLKWYIENTGFNAVELNMSFYRFPFPSLPKHWARVGSRLSWAIKVNQLITHRMKFSTKSIQTWQKFRNLFKPMEEKELIHFYLFQCPPSLRPSAKILENLENFIHNVDLGEMFAIEFRNEAWFKPTWERWAKKFGITLVSVDAPEFQNKIFRSSNSIYVRIHGRTVWYHHLYNEKELVEIYETILQKIDNAKRLYFFLNNNHGMLPTGRLIIASIGKYISGLKYSPPTMRRT